jgi:hypothetical protein
MRRILVLIVMLGMFGVLGGVAAGATGPNLKTSKARSLILKYAESKVKNDDQHGTPSNWGVVKTTDCAREAPNIVNCAWGLFWADGHECFNLRQVTAKFKKRNGQRRVVYTQKNLRSTSCDDNGSGNGGKSGRGTATDIDPSGEGPLGEDDNGGDGEQAP